MNICIVGGGNIGTAMAAEISYRHGFNISILTRDSKNWGESLEFVDSVTGNVFQSGFIFVTEEWADPLKNADMVFITVPSFANEQILKEIAPHVKPGAKIGFIPGSGGVEFLCEPLFAKGCVIFGVDRTPYVARVTERGKRVSASKKQKIRCAALLKNETEGISAELSYLLDMPVLPLNNYLVITFTPSNQILHTSRMYSLFRNGKTYEKDPLFYGDWDMESSEILLKCDDELKEICDSLSDMKLDEMVFLREHYESPNAEEMTKKIRSIQPLRKIGSPTVIVKNRFIPDTSSRYFEEDVPFGICVLKGFARACNIDTPNMDIVLSTLQDLMGKEYIKGSEFGRDSEQAGFIQKYGIETKEDIRRFYSG